MSAAPGESATARPFLVVGEREHRLYPLDPYQIDYVESAGNYVTYHLAGVEYIARESIKRLDALLVPAGFVRIERSLLLNVRAIAYAQPIGHGSFAFTLVSGAGDERCACETQGRRSRARRRRAPGAAAPDRTHDGSGAIPYQNL